MDNNIKKEVYGHFNNFINYINLTTLHIINYIYLNNTSNHYYIKSNSVNFIY